MNTFMAKKLWGGGYKFALTIAAFLALGLALCALSCKGDSDDDETVVQFDLSNGDEGLLIEAGGKYKFNGAPSGDTLKSVFAKAPKTGAAVSFDFSECDCATIPDGVDAPIVPADAKIKEIALPSNLQKIPYSFASDSYSDADMRFIAIGNETLETVSIPNNVTEISNSAFCGCKNLALTSLPADLTRIGYNAFYGCSRLALTSLPAGLTEIGGYAFSYCAGISRLEIPASVTTVGSCAFFQWTSAQTIAVPFKENAEPAGWYYGWNHGGDYGGATIEYAK